MTESPFRRFNSSIFFSSSFVLVTLYKIRHKTSHTFLNGSSGTDPAPVGLQKPRKNSTSFTENQERRPLADPCRSRVLLLRLERAAFLATYRMDIVDTETTAPVGHNIMLM